MITDAGREFATADVHRSNEIFQEQLLKCPVRCDGGGDAEAERQEPGVGKDFILDILDEHFSQPKRAPVRDHHPVGAYAQLFEYDAMEERLYPPEGVESAS